ncbi:MAG: acyl-CoA dehydrogenase C-terminal domain-containing protein [Cellvibrionaceae bacterium]
MTDYKPPLDDMRFIANEVFDIPSLWSRLPALAEVIEPDTADAILEEAAKLMSEVIHPLNQSGDELGCTWSDGSVTSPEGFKEAYQAFIEGGWNGLVGDPEYGGMGMPKTLVCHVEEMLQGASMSFGLAPMLTAGACLAIKSHASDELKNKYLPNMYEGVWSGAMDLTEPHAGTDLGIIRTKATPNEDGSYSVTGTKIFITWGEHDMAENIVHLVLAKLPDAPEGSKGISMFLVPKFLVNEDGSLGERNQLSCGSIEHKMGIHGSATCVMNYDGATGWLVGEAHKGLVAMFTMMNDERLAVGIQGLGVSDLAYQQSSAYAKERVQGRSPAGAEQPEKAADSILAHADVRRMLLTVRSLNEAGRAFLTYVAQWLDLEKFSEDEQEREHAESMVSLLTPIAKAFISDKSFDNTVLAQQVLGGHGYIREWGVEQLVRDARIAQIYEGANGIQAMDLLGRKTVFTQGKLLTLFIDDINSFISNDHAAEVAPYIDALNDLIPKVQKVTDALLLKAKDDPHAVGAAANNYLHLLGYLAYLFMWSKIVAAIDGKEGDFYRIKKANGQFFLEYLLPQADALLKSLHADTAAITALSNEDF